MSSIRHSLSFSLVKNPKNWQKKSIEQHVFPFSASDLAALMVSGGKLHLLHEMGGIPGLAGSLRTNAKSGLFHDEVEEGSFDKRQRSFGRNVILRAPPKTFLEHALDALGDPMLIILMIAGVVSVALGAYEHPSSGWTEGLAIFLAVVLVTVVSSINNVQQERAFRALEETTKEETYLTTRDDQQARIPKSQLCVGDLVELAAGDEVPADGILTAGDDPACNEAKMTGESDEIPKDAKRPFLLAGTELRKGQLEMIVVGVGINSTYGRIMHRLSKPVEDTPLQIKLEHVAQLIGYIGASVASLLFLTLVAFWLGDMIHDKKKFVDEADKLLDFFIIAVTIVVVAVPEGLPLAVTVSLAYSMKKMVKDQNLVRILSACETMGNCTTICSDKTGTLTLNKMTVMKGWLGGSFFDKLNEAPKYSDHVGRLIIEGVVVNSKATKERSEEGKLVWTGSQTEVALMQWQELYGIDIAQERDRYIVRKNYPFDSMKKTSSIIIKIGDKWRRYYKGAAEILFRRSSRIVDHRDQEVNIDGYRKEVSEVIEKMTNTGLRTIACAYIDYDTIETDPTDPTKLLDPPELDSLVFVSVVGIKDPLRPESRMSVRYCQRAGVIVRMVTGDHLDTARFIARECGILTSDKHVAMTGDEFRSLLNSKAEAEKIIPRLRVLARSQPEDKRLLVKWLKEHGEVVAATGDGTNDAPALTEAHVGIAMNLVGTAVAKAAAKILILDDNFASIVKSIMWGRSVYDNIRKFVQFQLTVNVVALSIVLVGAFTRYENPLKAVQLLWVNIIMDTMAALALGTEEPTLALLDRRPYSIDAPLISKVMWRNILAQSAFQLTALFVVLYGGADLFDLPNKSKHHYTMVFNSFVFLQIFNEINSRKVNNEQNVFEKFFANGIFSAILFVTVVVQIFMVEVLGFFAQTHPLSAKEWGICILIGFLCLPFGALVRLLKVDNTAGMISVAPDTFEGANLHEPDEFVHDATPAERRL